MHFNQLTCVPSNTPVVELKDLFILCESCYPVSDLQDLFSIYLAYKP